MENIKDIIGRVVGKLADNKSTSHKKIEDAWQNTLEKQTLDHTHLMGFRDGVLYVNVDSPAWLFAMKTKKEKILESIKKEISDVVDVNFKIGNIT